MHCTKPVRLWGTVVAIGKRAGSNHPIWRRFFAAGLLILLTTVLFACNDLPINTTVRIEPIEVDIGQTGDARLQDFNDRFEELNDVLANGVLDANDETLARIDALNDTIREINDSIARGVGLNEDTLARIDRLTRVVEYGVGLNPETRATIDRAVSELSSQPQKWQETTTTIISALEASGSELGDQLAEDVKGIVETTSEEVIRTVGSLGVEFRCNVDFAEQKAQGSFQRLVGQSIINPLKNIFGQETEPLQPEPWVCSIQPDTLVLSFNETESSTVAKDDVMRIFGFNFTEDNLPSISVRDASGTFRNGFEALRVRKQTSYLLLVNMQRIEFGTTMAQDDLVIDWGTFLSEVIILVPEPTPDRLATATTVAQITETADAIVRVTETAAAISAAATATAVANQNATLTAEAQNRQATETAQAAAVLTVRAQETANVRATQTAVVAQQQAAATATAQYCQSDSDGDGVTNCIELERSTNPNNPDTDGDLLSDYDEMEAFQTDAKTPNFIHIEVPSNNQMCSDVCNEQGLVSLVNNNRFVALSPGYSPFYQQDYYFCSFNANGYGPRPGYNIRDGNGNGVCIASFEQSGPDFQIANRFSCACGSNSDLWSMQPSRSPSCQDTCSERGMNALSPGDYTLANTPFLYCAVALDGDRPGFTFEGRGCQTAFGNDWQQGFVNVGYECACGQ